MVPNYVYLQASPQVSIYAETPLHHPAADHCKANNTMWSYYSITGKFILST